MRIPLEHPDGYQMASSFTLRRFCEIMRKHYYITIVECENGVMMYEDGSDGYGAHMDSRATVLLGHVQGRDGINENVVYYKSPLPYERLNSFRLDTDWAEARNLHRLYNTFSQLAKLLDHPRVRRRYGNVDRFHLQKPAMREIEAIERY